MPLTATQREHLAARLQEERTRALDALQRVHDEQARGSERDRAGDLTEMPFHMADLGTDTMDAELDASNETRMSRELAEIDAALDRLYRTPDRYGICEDTGAEIPLARLEMIPWARTCAAAREEA